LENKEPQNNFLKYSSLGLQLVVTIGVAAWGGLWLDRYLKFEFPVFLIAFVFLAFGGTMVQLYRGMNKD
jgi:F0F1-type ATP synthase assembly protein I